VALLHADMGRVIVWGCVVSIIASFFGWLYALAVGPKLESPPSAEFVGRSFVEQGREAELPTTFWAFAPILIPLVLIAAQSTASMLLPKGHILNRAMLFLGWPVVALSIGVLLAYRSTKRSQTRERTGEWVENALRTSAMMIMVVGLGGALSQILRQTPAVDAIAKGMESTGLPAIFLPFVLGIVGNMITGSTTVGVITSASIVAPMMPTLGMSPEVTMLSASAGGIITKYVNSSYFWVCTSLTRMPLRSALISFGGVMIVNGVVSMAVIYILWNMKVI
jgi:GntP family gluconate:H+ symporter